MFLIKNAMTKMTPYLRHLLRLKITRFLFIGGTGVGINLLVTTFFTEFVFGRENYFYGYLLGLFVNMIYNFILHTKLTFNTKKSHGRRFIIYSCYYILITLLQIFLVTSIITIVGVNFYPLVITGVIGSLSIVTFLVFKFWLFTDS